MPEKLVERDIIRGIVVYRFHKNNRDAADQYIQLLREDLQKRIEAGDIDKPTFSVIDISKSGMFSLQYMGQKIADLLKTEIMPHRTSKKPPVNYIAYVADSSSDKFLVNLINTITLNKLAHTRRIFQNATTDEAIDWLLDIKASINADTQYRPNI